MDSLNILWLLLLLYISQRVSSSSRFDFIINQYNEDVIDVVAQGALGDGSTDDSQAFLKAWKILCEATTDTPTLRIPSERTFLLNPVTFKGPCKSPNPHIQVLGNIVAPKDISAWTGSTTDYWILFDHVNGLKIYGSGQIDGQGSNWWSQKCPSDFTDDCNRPTAVKLEACNGLQLSGLKHINSQRNHISIDGCHNVTISNINITAPANSPNTDGIDISHSTHVHIKHSFIGTGDDCVAINGGCSNINITDVACGPGHGISVGSLGANGAKDTVEEINVHSCTFNRTMYGTRIKTWQGGSGYARKISFNQIILVDVRDPIIIDQYYCNKRHDCRNQTSAVKISNITYSGIRGTSENHEAINLRCSQTAACESIVIDQVNIASSKLGKKIDSYCFNAHGRSNHTSPVVPCLS